MLSQLHTTPNIKRMFVYFFQNSQLFMRYVMFHLWNVSRLATFSSLNQHHSLTLYIECEKRLQKTYLFQTSLYLLKYTHTPCKNENNKFISE